MNVYSNWLQKVQQAAKDTNDDLLTHIQSEAAELAEAQPNTTHHQEELCDLLNVASIAAIRHYGEIGYQQMLDKLLARDKKYGTGE